jgi:hypothetical protein
MFYSVGPFRRYITRNPDRVEVQNRDRTDQNGESPVRTDWVLGSQGRRVRLKIYCGYECLCKEWAINPIIQFKPRLISHDHKILDNKLRLCIFYSHQRKVCYKKQTCPYWTVLYGSIETGRDHGHSNYNVVWQNSKYRDHWAAISSSRKFSPELRLTYGLT